MPGQSGRLCALHLSFTLLAMSIWCVSAASADPAQTTCERRARTLGWAHGCGCLKHKLPQVERTFRYVLPGCGSGQHEAMARQLLEGYLESGIHDEKVWLCVVTCRSMDWPSIDNTIERHDGEEPI